MADARETAARLLQVLDRLVKESERESAALAKATERAEAMEAEMFKRLDRRADGEAPGPWPSELDLPWQDGSEPKPLDEALEEPASYRERLDMIESLAKELVQAGAAVADAREILDCVATIRRNDQAFDGVPFAGPEVPPLDDPATRYQQAADFFRGFASSFSATQAHMAACVAQYDAALYRARETARRIARSLGG